MYSTYFVSILTTIERLYHIPSKTAGAMLSATEVGQIIGSILVAYYGGRGSQPKWLSGCLLLCAFAALTATLPHFFFGQARFLDRDDFETVAPIKEDPSYLNDAKYYQGDNFNNNRTALPVCLFPSLQQLKASATTSFANLPDAIHNYHDIRTNTNYSALATTSNLKVSNSQYILVVFSLSLLFIGFASTAIVTLGIPFVDAIVSKEESPLYLGVTIGLRIFGPALGFILGSYCIQLKLERTIFDSFLTNIHNLFSTSTTSNINTVSASIGVAGQQVRYVETWWLGFIVISVPLIILSWPMYIFSKLQAKKLSNIPKTSSTICENQAWVEDEQSLSKFGCDNIETYKHDNLANNSHHNPLQPAQKSNGLFVFEDAKSLKSSSTNILTGSEKQLTESESLFTSLSKLMRNRLLMLRILSGILHILPIAGFYTFLPKYLAEQFSIDDGQASAITGLAGIMVVGFGAFFGGTMIRTFRLDSRRVSLWIACSSLLYVIGLLIMMNLGCQQSVTVNYSEQSLPLDCEKGHQPCLCPPVYNPICKGTTTYLSPCLAGCKRSTIINDTITLHDCSCESIYKNKDIVAEKPDWQAEVLHNASLGRCPRTCSNLKWYIITFSIFTMIHASAEVGAMIFNLRTVSFQDTNLALGMVSFGTALLGNIPCSILYGTLIDMTCIHWDKLHDSGGGKFGACRLYDNDKFRKYLHGTSASIMFLAFCVDFVVSRHWREVKFYVVDTDRQTTTTTTPTNTTATS